MDDLDPGGHPDLRDQRWARRAERDARKYLRKQRRRAFFRRNSNKLVSVVAVIAIAGLLGLLYRDGMLDRFVPQNWSIHGVDMPGTWHLDLNQPFAGTPAAGWADGATGIVIPDAPAVGAYSAQAVKTAMEQVRQVIVAARLDRRVLEGHDPEPYLSLLAPQYAAQIRPHFAPGKEVEASAYAARVADGYHLLPAQPKVNGTMSADVDKDGSLLVHTNYVVAYAFRPDHPETIIDAMDIVVVSRWEDTFGVHNGGDWTKDASGIWLLEGRGSDYSISCAQSKKGFLAPSFKDRAVGGPGDGDRNKHFDPAKPMPTYDTCPK